MAYNPPIRGITRDVPYLALVTEADPDWARYKFREIQYVTSQRPIYFNPYQGGAYNRRGNVYPVGAAYGQPDPLVIAALAPTVGNPVPGLY
jgi:hypothetical protein